MKKVKLKQGTLAWEKAKENRIGGSEVFDVVRYYAADEELQNCGINAEDFKKEKPYTSAWALYHKMKADGLYKREALAPEFAEYGHAAEYYGYDVLRRGRDKKIIQGEVYADDRLIVSLDLSGTAEYIDTQVPFSYGEGCPKIGQKFVCEQKTMMPAKTKNPVPFKYIVQAQHQITKVKADFFILQIMVLKEDSAFLRGKICQMSKATRIKFLDDNNVMSVSHLYFNNNYHLAQLIETCIDRFFNAVDNDEEPTPYIANDSQQNIIECIRANSLYAPDKTIEYNLQNYINAKTTEDKGKIQKLSEMQKIIEKAKEQNACKFQSTDGTTASFSKNGRFLVKEARI